MYMHVVEKALILQSQGKLNIANGSLGFSMQYTLKKFSRHLIKVFKAFNIYVFKAFNKSFKATFDVQLVKHKIKQNLIRFYSFILKF